jgi:Protein of unknown function (DUF2500)
MLKQSVPKLEVEQMIQQHIDNYVTFEVKSGDRMEFEVKPQEYRQLVEGNKGRLSFQSIRYLWFERKRHTESI